MKYTYFRNKIPFRSQRVHRKGRPCLHLGIMYHLQAFLLRKTIIISNFCTFLKQFWPLDTWKNVWHLKQQVGPSVNIQRYTIKSPTKNHCLGRYLSLNSKYSYNTRWRLLLNFHFVEIKFPYYQINSSFLLI